MSSKRDTKSVAKPVAPIKVIEKAVGKATEKKERKPSKPVPAIKRGLKLVRLADSKVNLAYRLTANWEGEATEDQGGLNAEVVSLLSKIRPTIARVLLNMDQLDKSGFNPTSKRGNVREPFAVGAIVTVKEDRFSSMFGPVNSFAVLAEADGMVTVRRDDDPKAHPIIVPRNWLQRDEEAVLLLEEEDSDDKDSDDDNDDDNDDDVDEVAGG